MSHNKDNKQKRNENVLKYLPTEVLLKARSTLETLSGALKPRQAQQHRPKQSKEDPNDRKSHDRLKISRSEPEFSEIRKSKRRSRIEDRTLRDYTAGPRPRPLSVGAVKRYEKEIDDIHCGSFSKDISPLRQRQFDSTEEVCVQSRLVIPVNEKLNIQDAHLDVSERPRKKLSFREPEIVESGSATLGRSHKLMGVNSLTQRPNRLSLRSELRTSSIDGLDSDLESQAMRIVRTVGQAFEVCHKMQNNSPEQPAPSTSSAIDDVPPSDHASDAPVFKEAASDCGASESGAASTSKVMETGAVGGREETARPKHLDLLPPPPRKDGRRSPQRATTTTPSINLLELPECEAKIDVTPTSADKENTTPLSAQHQLQLLRERLKQQAQQTRAAVAQLLLLRDQLAAEQAARCEAQARTHQLLLQNKELLEHIAALVTHLQDRERGSSRPINAQQLTLLPQMKADEGANTAIKTDNITTCNGSHQQLDTDALINLIAQSNKVTQNVENNNIRLSPLSSSPTPGTPANCSSSPPNFEGMSNEHIQNYLTSKFQNIGGLSNDGDEIKTKNIDNNYNQQFFQNCNAFPNIPPLTNHYSNTDIASLLSHKSSKDGCSSTHGIGNVAQAMSVGHSQNSLYSTSQATTSKDSTPDAFSSDDGLPFIMPLSHNGTLTATGDDGRVRLIVPVSPSESTTDVPELHIETEAQTLSGATLKVPNFPVGAPITRTTSEKVPNRSEMMTALRSQWTRHTTK